MLRCVPQLGPMPLLWDLACRLKKYIYICMYTYMCIYIYILAVLSIYTATVLANVYTSTYCVCYSYNLYVYPYTSNSKRYAH